MSTSIGPYSPVVCAGPWRICSGQLGLAPHSDASGAPTLVDGGVEAELVAALAHAEQLLKGVGASLHHVVKTTVFLVTMDDYAGINAAYTRTFSDHRPARSVVAVSGLPMGAAVEIELWAYVPEADPVPTGAETG
ncbi:MAG: RidA family protein [Acidimicrobiales bacterium]